MVSNLASLLLVVSAASVAAGNLDFYSDPRKETPKTHMSTAGQCDVIDVARLEEQEMLHSQDGQDRCLIQQYFPGICGGRYIEVGALDGDRFSNTFAFYNSPNLGWKGVNVEVDPVSYSHLSENRKNDLANVHAAVCSKEQMIHYAAGKFKAVGGIWEFSSPEQRDRWWPGLTLDNTTPVRCTKLQNIIDQILGEGSQYFDFMSLDIEGAELSALEGLDFSKVGFGVIVVEKQGRGQYGTGMDKAIGELLSKEGYVRIKDNQKTCGHRDHWFVNRDFEAIYAGIKNKPGRRQGLRG